VFERECSAEVRGSEEEEMWVDEKQKSLSTLFLSLALYWGKYNYTGR